MKLGLFDYSLPKNLIAQKQIKPRDHSRLLVINKQTEKISHDFFYNLDKYLDKNDVLVFNDSKVFPARILFDNGVEVFLLQEIKNGEWEVIGKKLKENYKLQIINYKLIPNFKCQILKKLPNGNWIVKFNCRGKKFREILEKIGETPLPPYIKTKDSKQIRKDYQTIYAEKEGSVAAPTAGLHFTKKVFDKLEKKGIKMEFVTLHVGLGTFQPVKTDKIEDHQMHSEYVVLDKSTAKRLNNYKKQGKRIIAVGTTSCRVLEALADSNGELRVPSSASSSATVLCHSVAMRRQEATEDKKATAGAINIFIYPGYKFKFIDAMITNFHLPKSTLLMLVSALAKRKFILKAYKEAIKKKYRFYSFGDGMFIK